MPIYIDDGASVGAPAFVPTAALRIDDDDDDGETGGGESANKAAEHWKRR